MFASWGQSVARWRWVVLIASFVAVAAAGAWGPGVVGRLSSGGFDDPGSPASVAAQRIADTVGRQDADVVALYTSATLTVDDPGFEQAVTGALATVPRADLAQVATYWTTGSPAFVGEDRRTTYAVIRLAADTREERSDTYDRIADALRATGPDVTTRLGGQAAVDGQISAQVSSSKAVKSEGYPSPLGTAHPEQVP